VGVNLPCMSLAPPPIVPLPQWPQVSVVMPVRNEAKHLAESLGSVLEQDYPGAIQVVIAVGPSTDDTASVAGTLASADPRVSLVTNPTGTTPDGLNAAIAASDGPIVARVDAHGALPVDYLRVAVTILHESKAANVGGRAIPEGTDATQKAIALAMGSPLGMGAARFRIGGAAGPADTVFPGVFRREWIEHVGGFNPAYGRAQDWEMNLRIRQAGGIVWFSPLVCVTYRPRSSLRALAGQFYSTGQWRRRLSQEHSGALNLRYLAPPAVTALVAVGAAGAAIWLPLGLIPLGYAAAVTLGGLVISRGQARQVRVKMPMVLATMHLSWGAGFIVGRRDRARQAVNRGE